MKILNIIVLIIACCMSLGTTLGSRKSALYKDSLNIMTAAMFGTWWILFILSISGIFNGWHLLWLFPLTYFVVRIMFKVRGYGLFWPFLLVGNSFSYLVTIIPTRNDKVRLISKYTCKKLIEIAHDLLMERNSYDINILNDVDFIDIIQKHCNIGLPEAEVIYLECQEIQIFRNAESPFPAICYHFIVGELIEQNIAYNESQLKTVLMTMFGMLDNMAENLKITENLMLSFNSDGPK